MESADLGKLFIGGISWDTNEDRLREYFKKYGEVVEAVIMKDRTTGRARGFGFIVFADPAVAERVVMEKHTIDGRTVEAKKAVPRDDPHILSRNSSSIHGSPGPGRTKKIFVGGLPSTITESEFKKYFDQFGTITDVVVMYDHNTQRPRGFGFITYDSEDAVDKVLLKTFHELNGKMVEVKRAVPKELSPGPSMRSPIGGYNYGMNRVNSLLNGYTQGYNTSLMGSYGMRMDGRLGTVASGRSGFPAFGPGFGLGMNIESSLSPSFGGTSSYNSTFGYGRNLSPYYSGSPGRYSNPIGYAGGNSNVSSVPSTMSRNIWDNGSLNYAANSANSNASLAFGSGSLSSFANSSLNWGSSPISAPVGGSASSYFSGNPSYGDVQNNFGLGNNSFGRSIDPGVANTSFVSSSRGYEESLSDLYAGSSFYGDPTWRSSTSELEGSDTISYGLGNAAQDIASKVSAGYMGGYNL